MIGVGVDLSLEVPAYFNFLLKSQRLQTSYFVFCAHKSPTERHATLSLGKVSGCLFVQLYETLPCLINVDAVSNATLPLCNEGFPLGICNLSYVWKPTEPLETLLNGLSLLIYRFISTHDEMNQWQAPLELLLSERYCSFNSSKNLGGHQVTYTQKALSATSGVFCLYWL